MSQHISWNSIGQLHNVITTFKHYQELDGSSLPTVIYRPKVKLHGTNCAVQIRTESIYSQSRTTMLTPDADYKGFAKWVEANETPFRLLPQGVTVFGEWCGPGIEKGMATSKLPGKIFCVFALQQGEGTDASITYDPETLQKILKPATDCPDLYVLPWEDTSLTLDYASESDLQDKAACINTLINKVEAEDPWVKRVFNISGLGEGVVFYPVAVNGQSPPIDPETLARFMFKAKGEKHRTTNATTPAQVEVAVLPGVEAFVEWVLPEARLLQGVTEACGGTFDLRSTGKFLAWIVADVKKETTSELLAAGLSWEQVAKPLQAKAREWLKSKTS